MIMKSKYDAIVIGSGAAGSVMAFELAKKGLSVLILEKGRYNTPSEFKHDELKMYAKLYKLGGMQTTKDNDTTIAQGMTVGGSTVINNAIWLRAPLDRILPEWKKLGCHIPKDKIVAAYEELEEKLHVDRISPKNANAASKDFLTGCNKLGIPAEYLKHNRKDCIGCGWCNYGCQYNRKTSMLVTFIPWAIDLGAHLIDQVERVTIMKAARQAKAVMFYHNKKKYTIRAEKVIVCAGAIGSSGVLLKSGIDQNGQVGKGLHLLGGFFVNGLMPQVVNGYEGIGLSCIADASDDYLIETFFAPPGIFSITLSGWYEEHHQRMLDYSKYLQAGVMVGSKPTGTISLNKKKLIDIDFKFDNDDLIKMKAGLKTLGRILFAAGAVQVLPATFKNIVFNSPKDLDNIDEYIQTHDDLILGSSHPQGGNLMSEDPQKGAVDNNFKVHGYSNLYVVDASVFPTNLWANCQATVMAMSKYASSIISN